MKKILNLSFIIIFICSSHLLASNYYWVGGTGAWSDYATHWATSSGGTVFHVTIPSPNDDVFFDANSFPTTGDTVYLDSTITNCRNMDWSGGTNTPVVKGNNGTVTLDIYGSFILNPAMTWMLNCNIHFKSTSAGNIINTGGILLLPATGDCNIQFDSAGTWDLQSSLLLGLNTIGSGNLTLGNGTLNTNGYPVTCGFFSVNAWTSATILLGTSFINCYNWEAESGNTIIDADSATFQCQMHFKGGENRTYKDVGCWIIDMTDSCSLRDVSCNIINGQGNTFRNATMLPNIANIYSGNVFNKITVTSSSASIGATICDTIIFNNPGQSVILTDILRVNGLLLIQSDPSFPSSFEANNGTGTVSKPNDTVCTDFIYLKNIAATGGAVFFAGDHSVDLGGNTGWNWTRCAPLISNVWPGDCNYDLVTDNFDLLNIGVSFGDTGYVRPAASLSYTAQPCQDWYYQFINAANVKHADCDGNGIVDANDSSAISLNYGLTHPARLMHQHENNSVGTELDFVLPPVIVPGSAVSVPVTLGTNIYPATNIYGIAFTVNYDPAFIQPGTMIVDYASSWVENAGNHLHIEKDFPGSGKTDIAFTRIDHSDVSSYGMIATLNFIASPTANGPFNLSFSHVKVISHNEIEIPIQTGTSTTWVNIEEAGNQIASTVFPNPMTKDAQVIFSNPNHETWYLSMKDLTGRILSQQQITSSNSFLIERKDLNSGVYFYVIKNNSGKNGFGKLIIE